MLKMAGLLATGLIIIAIIFNIMNLSLLLITIKLSRGTWRLWTWPIVYRYYLHVCIFAFPDTYLQNTQNLFLSTPFSNIPFERRKGFFIIIFSTCAVLHIWLVSKENKPKLRVSFLPFFVPWRWKHVGVGRGEGGERLGGWQFILKFKQHTNNSIFIPQVLVAEPYEQSCLKVQLQSLTVHPNVGSRPEAFSLSKNTWK